MLLKHIILIPNELIRNKDQGTTERMFRAKTSEGFLFSSYRTNKRRDKRSKTAKHSRATISAEETSGKGGGQSSGVYYASAPNK